MIYTYIFITGSTKYPCVPGHELAGVVSAVGPNVTKFKVLAIQKESDRRRERERKKN